MTSGGRLNETTIYIYVCMYLLYTHDCLTVICRGIAGIRYIIYYYTSSICTTRVFRTLQLTSLSRPPPSTVLAIVNRLNTTHTHTHTLIFGESLNMYDVCVGATDSGDNLLKLNVAYVKESLRAAVRMYKLLYYYYYYNVIILLFAYN